MKKNIIIVILISIIFLLIVENYFDRKFDRAIIKIEFQKALEDLVPPTYKVLEKKLYI